MSKLMELESRKNDKYLLRTRLLSLILLPYKKYISKKWLTNKIPSVDMCDIHITEKNYS